MSSDSVPHLSANFQPSLWGDCFINVATLDEVNKQQMQKEIGDLKKEVKKDLRSTFNKPTEQLEFIDAIERLGVGYHFVDDIEEALDKRYPIHLKEKHTYKLHHVSIGFRIFRQHGIKASPAVFERFMCKKGFQGNITNDVEGILSMYEACHVRLRDDDILEEGLDFTTTFLSSTVHKLGSPMARKVEHALHQPLHKGIIRVESKQYISFYELNPLHNATLLRLAKLDFNLLQSLHQMELRELALWWKELHAKLPFTRDRSVEGYFWALGCYYEPQYSIARKIFTRMFMIQQVLDDIYDSFGTIEHKQFLTEAVKRWDYSYVTRLPKYFSDCYKALLETFDEAEQILANEGRSFCIHYAKEQMKLNCEAWFEEAKWCNRKYIPTYDEYMKVALISVGHITGIATAYLGMGEIATRESFEWSARNPMPKIVRASDVILRLMNDIGGHKFEQDREHVASSIECYKKQHNVSNEEQVYKELERQVKEAWKDVNEGMLKPYPIPKPLLDRTLNFARVPEVMYKGRTEGYTLVNKTIQHKVASVLIHPIPL